MKLQFIPLVLLIVGCVHRIPTLAEQNVPSKNSIVVRGVIQNLQRDWSYETPCGIIASILQRCDGLEAYVGEIRLDSVQTVQIMFFRHSDGRPHPMNGDSGYWTLHWDAVYRYLTCAQRSGMTSACLAEMTWVIESDDDMDIVNPVKEAKS